MDFESFDSVEDMLNAMHAREDTANRNTTPEQKAIGYGDYFVRIWGNDFEGYLKIYGQVMPREELFSEEERLGAEPAELSYTMRSHDDSYSRGYRFGWCYSVVEPDGELGSTHVSTMFMKITEEQFEEAKKNGWR